MRNISLQTVRLATLFFVDVDSLGSGDDLFECIVLHCHNYQYHYKVLTNEVGTIKCQCNTHINIILEDSAYMRLVLMWNMIRYNEYFFTLVQLKYIHGSTNYSDRPFLIYHEISHYVTKLFRMWHIKFRI